VFGRKQELTKELEDELQECRRQLEDAQEHMSLAQKSGRGMLPYFGTQIAAQSEMDGQLTKVVEYTRDTITVSGESQKVFDKIALEIAAMRQKLEEEEPTRKELLESMRSQKEQMQNVARAADRFTTPMNFIQQVQGGLAADVEETSKIVNGLAGCAKQMSVLSLNCAIEAGRMGRDGERFIGAAEDIRRISVEYEEKAQEAERQLAGMSERVRQLEEQVGNMAKYLDDSNASVARLSADFSEKEKLLGGMKGKTYLDKAETMADWLKEIAGNHETITSLQNKTMSEMENIGESFMDEQKARKELERLFGEIMDHLNS